MSVQYCKCSIFQVLAALVIAHFSVIVFLQLVGCLGFLLGHIPLPAAHYTHFAMETVGDLSARLWTCLLATALLLVECRNLCSLVRLQPLFFILAWG